MMTQKTTVRNLIQYLSKKQIECVASPTERNVKSQLGYTPNAAPPDLVNVRSTIDNKNPDYKPPSRGPRQVNSLFKIFFLHW